ncbi:hypothetical protein [Tessaracoccus antarcticus]|uniref:Uncharacterized protein n=1 Tax=Tessaracoccus antarcticus TaxID=2479848 RepID=A0A3M0GB35_9ACTN|nr:hypothetical protein [Tessaracoccus antarcticus]RMB62140.1 hypothetical protein EAX62_06090 [Tessaracoccus antarcticus]
MLAGIVIFVLVVAGLAFGLPWLSAHRHVPDTIDGDPSQRFSGSMRIMHREVVVQAESDDVVEVSTPLTRRAELTELRLHAAGAARRRRHIAVGLAVISLVLGALSMAGVLAPWAPAIPAGLLIVFLGIARFSVRAMQRSLDARAQNVGEGYGDEDTGIIDLGQDEESIEISVDLSAPHRPGALWDPIPVTAPTYVSKPLVPRTVRTIDLSAPVVAVSAVVPTADHPDRDVEELELEDTQRSNLYRMQPRAVGE